MIHGFLRIVFRHARAIDARPLAVAASLLLSACGGTSTSSAPPPKPTPSPLPGVKFYLPLAVGNTWTYNCGGTVTITNHIPAKLPAGSVETFEYVQQFPDGTTQTQLLANNPDGTTTIYGYMVGGSPVFVVPSVIIGANPTPGQAFNYPAPNTSIISRIFTGLSTTKPTKFGVFNVAVYSETSGADTYSYALSTGVAEQTHGSSDCLVTSVILH
jgi:hypothetical protein